MLVFFIQVFAFHLIYSLPLQIFFRVVWSSLFIFTLFFPMIMFNITNLLQQPLWSRAKVMMKNHQIY